MAPTTQVLAGAPLSLDGMQRISASTIGATSSDKFVETIHAPEDDDKYDVFYAASVIEPQEEIPFKARV